jgi:hypothetical protein
MTTTRSFRKPRKLAFHSLEERTLMAGDVRALVIEGSLQITGDAGANDVAVVQNMQNGSLVQGSYTVTGRNGTTINGQSSRTFTNVLRDININMGENDDRVTLGPENDFYGVNNKFFVPRNLLINAGGGNNTVVVNELFIAHNAWIISGTAADSIYVHAQVENDLQINTRGGNDLVDVWNGLVRHDITIDTGVANTSDVTVYLTKMDIGNDATVTTGAGKDFVIITEIGVDHDLSIQTGDNNDQVSIRDSEVSDLLFAYLGSGNDKLSISNTNGDRAVLDGGDGFFDSLVETNVNFHSSHVSRRFEPWGLPIGVTLYQTP